MAKLQALERYITIKATVFDSPAFRTLPPSAAKLWIDLRTQFRGRNNGNISATLKTLAIRSWCSSETLNRALWELLDRGLLRRTREGKPGPLRICALYAFTDLPTDRNDRHGIEGGPATREFLSWVHGNSFAPNSKATKLASNPNKKKSPLLESEQYYSGNRTDTAPKTGELIPIPLRKPEPQSLPNSRRKRRQSSN